MRKVMRLGHGCGLAVSDSIRILGLDGLDFLLYGNFVIFRLSLSIF